MARKRNRPRPTLFDYALIAINPALVMLMVGSLMFFLVVVLYRGEFETRLCFILAMFVMAIVLITRISIEEGTQYASRFAIPLAIAVFLALGRFVSFPGPLAFISVWINCGLMALVWWSSHRITWDCTVINESVEAPGEGLLQSAGLERGVDSSAGRHDLLDGTSVTDQQVRHAEPEKQDEPPLAKIWRAYREAARKPHSHGMWVVYFAIAALPIFGLGQGFVDSLGGRRYAFFLFCIYLLSSLGLLMTTSLLGLRRYLRQRHLEMPASIPVAWFGTGGLLILVILLACLVLPRPYPEYSVSHSDWFATSPVTLETNFWGTFEGKESPDGAASDRSSGDDGPPSSGDPGETSGPADQSPNGNGQSSGDSQGANGESSDAASESRGEASRPGDPSTRDDGSPSSGERGETSGPADPSPNGNGQSSGDSQGANGESSDATSESESESSRPGDRSTDERQSDVAQSSQDGSESDGQSTDASGQSTDASGQSTDASGQPSEERSESTTRSTGGSSSRSTSSSESSSTASRSENAADENEVRGSSAISSPRSPSSFPSFAPSLAGILNFLYYLILVVAAAFLLWKFREPLRDGLQKFWQDLRNWLAGRRGDRSEASHAEEVPEAVPQAARFSEFSNPFRPGERDSRSPAELVRYSFLALEAWAREFQVARRSDETPLEFARRVGTAHPSLSRASRDVCLLYSQLAYGGGQLPAEAPNHLRHFWTTIEADSA